jgi:hypothetical protein
VPLDHLADDLRDHYGLHVCGALLAVVFAVLASGSAAGPALSLFEFLLGPADAVFPGRVLFGAGDPAGELVAGHFVALLFCRLVVAAGTGR